MRAPLLSVIAQCHTLPGVYLVGSEAVLASIVMTDEDMSIIPGGAKISHYQSKPEIQLAWV